MIERKVSVGFGSNSYTKVRVSQFDSAWTFVFAVYLDGDRWTIPSGVTVTMNGKKPDKNVFSYSGTVSNNTVRVDGDIQMTAVAGLTVCELVFLESSGKTIGTANFILAVEEAPKSPDDVDSESTLPAYAAILNAVSEDDESVRKAKESENKAAASAAEAQQILDSIPSDYSALQAQANKNSGDITELQADLTAEQTTRENADNVLGEDITALSEDVETNYARIDGYYDSLGVGMADQLASNKYTEDNEPYVYRTSGGTADIGDREYDEIVGGSVVWNQLAKYNADSTFTQNGLDVTITASTGVVTINGTATARTIVNSALAKTGVGHKMLVYGCPKGGSMSTYRLDDGYGNYGDVGNGIMGIKTVENYVAQIVIENGTVCNNLVFRPQSFDLTKMFGTAVADAIYAINQAEAGAGVKWFKKLFPLDYYAYNAGELVSVSALQSHDMIGFNQWDVSKDTIGARLNLDGTLVNQLSFAVSDYIRVFPDTKYYLKNVAPSANTVTTCFYDSNKNFVKYQSITGSSGVTVSGEITSPSDAQYIRITRFVTEQEPCINLSWSGWRNGEYEAYDKHSYPLDSSLTLRGIPKVDSAGNMYYDGDIYASDGTVTRKYGVVDLGALTWIYTTSGYFSATVNLNYAQGATQWTVPIAVCSRYQISAMFYITNSEQRIDKRIGFCYNEIRVSDSTYTDAAAFKTAMSGVYLVYELAEPTTETAQPYASPQIVDDFGTEEYVSTAEVRIPVGHSTKYMANLRDKLVHLPNLADSDGAYLIQQDGHTMELVKFRIPKAPTTDGTYTLKATVSGGTPTYTWEVVE